MSVSRMRQIDSSLQWTFYLSITVNGIFLFFILLSCLSETAFYTMLVNVLILGWSLDDETSKMFKGLCWIKSLNENICGHSDFLKVVYKITKFMI